MPSQSDSKKINFTSKTRLAAPAKGSKNNGEVESDIANMMMDPRYLRQSSALIQDALQKGFDVLQLANGDIVTTGTKTVVYQYTWDEEKGKLVKTKSETVRRGRRPVLEEDEEMLEAEDA